jgi:hypothetical protein
MESAILNGATVMTIDISIRINDEFVETVSYNSPANVPIPNVGEAVINPKTDGLVVKVVYRIFEYAKDHIRVTLDCE